MPSLTPLSPDQIADFFGALDDFIGTGDGVTANYQATYFPLVDTIKVSDELTGVGDGVTTAYQLFLFPIDSGTLELHKTAIAGTALVLGTDYTVNLTNGQVTLTPAGVTALGTEQLHSKYSATTTIELHKGTITGPALIPTTDYTLTTLTGKIKLTAAGIASLGTSQLHAKYQITTGLVYVLMQANAGIQGSIVTMGIQQGIFDQKDQSLKYLHETVESKAILHLEAEREPLQNPTAIIIATPGNFVQPSEVVDETAIVNSVTNPYRTGTRPLYPNPGPNSPDQMSPFQAIGLFGGDGSNAENEEQEILDELADQAGVISAGADVTGHPGPSPARSGWYLRYDHAILSGGMVDEILDQNTALADQVTALTAFLADNPSPTDLVSSGDIANANAAITAANAQITANNAFLAAIPYPSSGPYPGLSNANLSARTTAQATRQTQVATRISQVTTLLTSLYNVRFFYIAMRTRLVDGTKRKVISLGNSIVASGNQITANSAKITQILALLAGQ